MYFLISVKDFKCFSVRTNVWDRDSIILAPTSVNVHCEVTGLNPPHVDVCVHPNERPRECMLIAAMLILVNAGIEPIDLNSYTKICTFLLAS